MGGDRVIVEALRGGRVESRHAAAVSVRDASGGHVLRLGDVARPIYPRSAVKALQALPFIESGAVEAFGLAPDEIALACASHSGEPAHVAGAAAMLRKAGRDASSLECGAHWPSGERAARALAAAGDEPGQLHNNCSGKHAGFVCLACAAGEDSRGYVKADHFVQREVKSAIETMAGITLAPQDFGVDGCSIPTWPTPLEALALAFARFGSGHDLAPARLAAARKIRQCVAAHPFMVAGTGRFDTEVMGVTGERAFTKTGAEGVFCAAFPQSGLGVAIKIEDGAGRASEAVMAALVGAHAGLNDAERDAISRWLRPTLRNWNGIEVGELRVIGLS